jgi:hypothetical protein
MTICVKIWLSMDTCVKYAQCVKIRPFVWKYGYWCLGSVSEVCVVSEALCLVSGGHYTESSNSLVSDEENVRRARAMRVLYLRKVRHAHRMHVLYPRKGRRTHRTCVSLLHNMHKKNSYRIFSKGCSLRQRTTCPLAHIRERMCDNGYPEGPTQEASCGAQGV